jgi:hypothetical protein
MAVAPDAELVIGLVTPVGTNTAELASILQGALSDCAYTAIVTKLSELLPVDTPPPVGECEDERVKRLIAAGNDFCKDNDDPAALARLAVKAIRDTRLALFREDQDDRPAEELVEGSRRRTAYILQSMKRSDEVELLRKIYGGQFISVGSQGTVEQRKKNLLRRPVRSLAKRVPSLVGRMEHPL